MIIKPCDSPGETGYWNVELGPLTTDEVRDLIERMEEDGWTIVDQWFPAEFQREER